VVKAFDTFATSSKDSVDPRAGMVWEKPFGTSPYETPGHCAALIPDGAEIFNTLSPSRPYALLRGLLRGNSEISKLTATDLPEKENDGRVLSTTSNLDQ
jgi:hypothetical protein